MKTARNVLLFLFLVVPGLLTAQNIDKNQLLEDLKQLSSEKMQGRKLLSEGNKRAQDYIIHRFSELGLTSQYKNFTQSFRLNSKHSDEAANIIGFIPGEESSKIMVIMAHYDHLGIRQNKIFPGADDNASGTASLLALAEHFMHHRPRYSLLFAALDAEEAGLLGAKALVKDFPFPLDQVLVAINMDMISRSETNRLYAVGTRHYPHLRPFLIEASKESGIDMVLGNDGAAGSPDWTNSSDHAAFHAKGIPFIYFGVDDHRDYHQESDTFENIDEEFYYQAVLTILQSIKKIDKGIH